MEARGFILGAPVALALGVGFVPVRKAGKLPRATYAVSYALEYGEATLEIHQDALQPGDRVLARRRRARHRRHRRRRPWTWSRECGASVHGIAMLMELSFLARARDARRRAADLPADRLSRPRYA